MTDATWTEVVMRWVRERRRKPKPVTSHRAAEMAPDYCPRCGIGKGLVKFAIYTAMAEGFVAGLLLALLLVGLAEGQVSLP
jgi:hypothetical protein